MKLLKYFYITFLLITFFSSVKLYSQNSYGWERIFSSTYGINGFYSQVNYDGSKLWMVRPVGDLFGTGNYDFIKYNNNSNSWYIASNSIFRAPYYIYSIGSITISGWSFPPAYAYSNNDTNFVLINTVVIHTSSPPSDFRLFSSYDNGNTRTDYAQFQYKVFTGLAINPLNDSVNYALYTDTIYKSVDRGVSWSANSYIPSFKGKLSINPVDTSIVYGYGLNDSLFISTNSGNNFSYVTDINFEQILYRNSDSAIIGLSRNKLFLSEDFGHSWNILDTLPELFNFIEVDPDNESIVYAGTRNGLYKSVNYGYNLSLFNNSFSPTKNVIGICKEPNKNYVYVVTEEAVYKCWSDYVIGINLYSTNIPDKYLLYQNYPNPFNPNTKIRFDLAYGTNSRSSHVKLSVYNSLGKEVRVLINESKSAGAYEVDFNGYDLSSGIYFYQLILDGKPVDTKKLTLLK